MRCDLKRALSMISRTMYLFGRNTFLNITGGEVGAQSYSKQDQFTAKLVSCDNENNRIFSQFPSRWWSEERSHQISLLLDVYVIQTVL